MAGTGMISFGLQQLGVDIVATDNYSWNKCNDWFNDNNLWTDIEKIDALDAIEKYGRDIDYIIMSWAYMDDTAATCLIKMRNINPNCKMIYIGEGGCMANDNFFENMKAVADVDDVEANDVFMSWYGIHDRIMVVK